MFGEILLPVCSPALLKRSPRLRRPADLARHVLLCSLHRPDDWPTWLAEAGVAEIDGNDGLKFENSALAYQAAIDEVGIVVAQRAFVEDDVQLLYQIAVHGRRDLELAPDEYAGFTMTLMRMLAFVPVGLATGVIPLDEILLVVGHMKPMLTRKRQVEGS